MRRLFAVLLLIAAPVLAQSSDEITFQRTFLLRNISGTSFNPGPVPHHPLMTEGEAWTTFVSGALFATYSSETGPHELRHDVFSTNWLAAGAQRTLGSRGLLLLRGRVSAEPLTVKEDGYPQILQYISAENGGPMLDSMRAHDLVGEAAVDLAYRTTTASFLHFYAAPVGDPAFGTVPYAQRSSSEEFTEAPFAYDVQETVHDSTRVVTAGFASRFVTLEGSVFHDAVTAGRHTSIDNGPIDSRSARLVIMAGQNIALQVSRAELGDDKREATSASVTVGTQVAALSAIWTRRLNPDGDELTSGMLEATFHGKRNTVMARLESVDRPRGFLGNTDIEQTTHFAVGYIFDFVARSGTRAGAGVNFDYHTKYRDLPSRYGHKPQGLYAFIRLRTDAMRR